MEVGRFAPSPSGRMHLGNLFCSLLAWLSARSAGGRVVLRIEDLDPLRCPRAFADEIERDLGWLGLFWDEGGSLGGPRGPYYQQERTALYAKACGLLAGRGLAYPCFCSRAQLHAASAPHREDGAPVYPGTCRALTEAERAEKAQTRPPALRLTVPNETVAFTDGHLGRYAENLASDCGDFILRRSDGVHAYQLAVVLDDAAMGVTQVVRGADLLSSTPRQIYLYRLLGLPAPRFYHLPLLTDAEGRRLSKRDGDVSLERLRQKYTPEEVVGRLAFLAGLQPAPAPRTAQSLVEGFAWEKVPREDVRIPKGLF